MKKKTLALICVVAAIVVAAFGMNQGPLLFNDGESEYSIVLCDNASISEQTAAKELQGYLQQISGALLPLVNSNELAEGGKHIFVGFNEEYATKYGVELPSDSDEGYTYRTVGDNIWIYGGKNRGTMYGVYSFLENEFGVRWYTVDYTKIPTAKTWRVKELCHSEQPFIQYRFVQYFNADYGDWQAHNKCNSATWVAENEYGGLTAYWEGHTFRLFITAEEYFEEHPEYFSLREGERRPNEQVCL